MTTFGKPGIWQTSITNSSCSVTAVGSRCPLGNTGYLLKPIFCHLHQCQPVNATHVKGPGELHILGWKVSILESWFPCSAGAQSDKGQLEHMWPWLIAVKMWHFTNLLIVYSDVAGANQCKRVLAWLALTMQKNKMSCIKDNLICSARLSFSFYIFSFSPALSSSLSFRLFFKFLSF